ncbi:MAG: 4Fe-4S binding protein [Deltaproteobacteria bacterium]|nr:4Fe-4S binding protein [Deltaproteobacteria bacterium]
MRIVTVRRLSQVFFLILFLWFCITATLGTAWWRLRGWPVNWFLELDPLTALATVLATGTLYTSLAWALLTLFITLLVGRFFCGFVCPLGALSQAAGWLARRRLDPAGREAANRHHPLQSFKYYLLSFLLLLALLGSVQTGVFDPLPLVYRSVNLALAPLADNRLGVLSDVPRAYASVWLIGVVFLAVLGLTVALPRFFCRFLCPLGALFGLLSRFTPWRLGKSEDKCGDCRLCEQYCEGACRPSGAIIGGECVLCFNCFDRCPAGRLTFAGRASAAGEAGLPDLSRRGFVLSGAGVLLASLWGVGALAGPNRNPTLIRPPGALDEERFLGRCIRCGQCMRVCPANILQPALLESGVQGLWTPVVNYRLGLSGCLPTCVACGHLCPTAAIRPLSLEERQGLGPFAKHGPIRLGTAFVDRGRCLPWALDRPCLVCQEVCPVSPKAIFIRTVFETVRDGHALPARIEGQEVILEAALPPGVNWAGGDYFLRPAGHPEAALRRLTGVSGNRLTLERPLPGTALLADRARVDLAVKLDRPFVDAARCIGCGMCEHECPVVGLRAIRVYSENESRSGATRLLI